MKKFILKTAFFVVPIAILYSVTAMFYVGTENPDLLRMGYIPNIYKEYTKKFDASREKKFENLSERKKKKYQIMTIGDSFSLQGNNGYKNMLADNFTVLHIDNFISRNQIKTLAAMVNGDFFDKYNIEYVVLQNIERHIIDSFKKVIVNEKLTVSEIDSLINNYKPKENEYKYKLFSKTTLEFPIQYLPKFFLEKNYLSNDAVYNLDLNSNTLFSNKSNKLLFYNYDVVMTEINSNKKNIDSLNLLLNDISFKLKKRGVKLIFLPCPDKYDFYYNYIADKKGFPKSVFFNLMSQVKKDYIYIDSKAILSKRLSSTPDLYFYDDTHWSPLAAKIIADKIQDAINHDQQKSK